MPYAFTQDVPADEAIYRQIKDLLPPAPEGLVVHVAMKREGGLRYVDVWESEQAWARFRDDHVEPAVGKVLAGLGIAHSHGDVTTADVDIVDVWLGGAR